jgi:hypothetical protein
MKLFYGIVIGILVAFLIVYSVYMEQCKVKTEQGDYIPCGYEDS